MAHTFGSYLKKLPVSVTFFFFTFCSLQAHDARCTYYMVDLLSNIGFAGFLLITAGASLALQAGRNLHFVVKFSFELTLL